MKTKESPAKEQPGMQGEQGSCQNTVICKESFNSRLFNFSALPAVSEGEYLRGCPRCEIRARLRTLSMAVRDRKMIRIVIKGMPYYVLTAGVRA